MAVDEALLASACGGGPLTLRLYTWSGAWLSLGYGQTLPPARAEACARAGVGVVRRMTGGRAVLHGADLTYAVAAPESSLPSGLQGSYALVSRALVRALAALGIAADPASAPAAPGGPAPFDCFARAAEGEICVAGRKLAGSAQRRTGGGVLQHGSLRVGQDPPAASDAAGSVPGAATSLEELGVVLPEAALQSALVAAFEAELGGPCVRGELTAAEQALAEQRTCARVNPPWDLPEPVPALPSRPPIAGR
jgi:lipoate-protein ligase A